MALKAASIRNRIALVREADTGKRMLVNSFSIREAHDLVRDILVALESAQGYQDVLDGKVPDPASCPNCRSRNISASHACRRVKRAK